MNTPGSDPEKNSPALARRTSRTLVDEKLAIPQSVRHSTSQEPLKLLRAEESHGGLRPWRLSAPGSR